MFTEMLDKINKYLEEREEKKYQKLQRELEEEYGDPEEVPESTYEEVENTNETKGGFLFDKSNFVGHRRNTSEF